jgi:hypothetical protein
MFTPNNNVVKYCDYFMNQSLHIDKMIDKQILKPKLNNQLRLKTSIDFIQYSISSMLS